MIKKILVAMVLSLGLMSCGSENAAKQQDLISGTGVMKNIRSLEFNGLALYDLNTDRMYDVTKVSESKKIEGAIIQYQGTYPTQIMPAGVPEIIDFTKFEVIGVEN